MKLVAGIAAQEADRQARAVAVGNLRRLRAHSLVIRRRHQTLLIKIRPGLRQRKRTILPFQKLEAQLAFYRLHLPGNGGLRNVVFLRRRGKAVQPHHRLKMPKLLEHPFPPPSRPFPAIIAFRRGAIQVPMCASPQMRKNITAAFQEFKTGIRLISGFLRDKIGA